MSKLLLLCILYFAFVSAALRKRQDTTNTVKTQTASDTPDTLYAELMQYRLDEGNMHQTLTTTEYYPDQTANELHGKAKIEVEYLLKNMDTFGLHKNFETNSGAYSQYCEVIAKVLHKTTDPYKYAFDLWKEDTEIQQDFRNEFTAADTDCQ